MKGPLPALRAVEPSIIEHEGQPHIIISDPAGIVEEQLALSPHAYLLALCLDGMSDLEGVRQRFAAHAGGHLVDDEHIMRVVEVLDYAGFLWSARYHQLRRAAEKAYRDAPARVACFAGRSYPEEAAELRTFIDRFFTGEGGPGSLPSTHGGDAPPLPALIVPHIDYHRGGFAYGHGYKRLFEAGKPDTVFIFGVAHASPPVPFVLTRKDFATPFGTLEVDQEAVDSLAAVCDYDPFEYELTHRNEHSIEFQAVMLGYLYGTDVKIVPILCAAMTEDEEEGEEETAQNAPGMSAQSQRFLARCHELAADPARRIAVIAGADLAHVGQRFGDEFDITDDVVEATSKRDDEDLRAAVAGSADDWYTSVMRDHNERRVCGLGCIYATLKTVEGAHKGGELLHYGYAPDPAGGIVSFASVQYAPAPLEAPS